MKNVFKGKIILVALVGLSLMTFVGCGALKISKSYTSEENKVIDFANSEISKKYDVKFNKDELNYSVAKEVEENKFQSLSQSGDSTIVVVSANRLEKPKKGQVINYKFIYNTKEKTIVNSDVEIY